MEVRGVILQWRRVQSANFFPPLSPSLATEGGKEGGGARSGLPETLSRVASRNKNTPMRDASKTNRLTHSRSSGYVLDKL